MSIIQDLETEVIIRCENRTTDTARADIWIQNALLEISGNPDYRDEFDDLEEYGPQYNLTPSTQEYAFSNIVPAGDYNLSTLDVLLWTDYPTNTIRKKLQPTHYQDADKFQQAMSIPAEWYRFADTIGFNPVPNQPYQVQARILRRHPFTSPLNQTVILLPQEWNEILIWAAAMRGFMELLEFEKAGEIRTLLQGDPKYPDKQGLIGSVKKRRRREAWRDTSSLRPVIRGYGWGSG
jgi:hypothetical protein